MITKLTLLRISTFSWEKGCIWWWLKKVYSQKLRQMNVKNIVNIFPYFVKISRQVILPTAFALNAAIWRIFPIFPIFQNFGVCSKCSRLAQLYHKLHHQKQSMFNVCSDVVETRKKSNAGLDTTRMLNELLADDSWLETVSISEFSNTYSMVVIFVFLQQFRRMQDLWADADTFVR